MIILGIETSCDETSASIVKDGAEEISTVTASSYEFHEKTGGIVPEVAARKQVEFMLPVLKEILNGKSKQGIDALAVTVGPGLVGSLIVGVEAAKALSLAWEKPLIPVNHLVGHIYANFLTHEDIPLPSLALVVSGGHTDLVLMKNHGDLEYIGSTLDDAAGEAFDKTARILGIKSYLGGALLSQAASECEDNFLKGRLPRPMIFENNYDFSFSGLKTAVSRLIKGDSYPVSVVAREFEDAVVDVLVVKALRAGKNFGAKAILLGGGVSANSKLRSALSEKSDIPVLSPSLKLCGDSATYIASAAFFNQKYTDLDKIVPNSSLSITD